MKFLVTLAAGREECLNVSALGGIKFINTTFFFYPYG